MLSDENKLLVCRTLDNCWFFNLTKQNMCQDIFQTFNRVWNSYFASNFQTDEVSTDNVKFRKLLEGILKGEMFSKFILSKSLDSLSEISPLIHDDGFVSNLYGRPFSLSEADLLTEEERISATGAHREFNSYLSKVREKANSDNKKKFINKLSRLLYVVRSNIAHGSKLQYTGSVRNEQICEVIYQVLLDLSNLILGNGLFKIAAYGELKQNGRLFSPLVNDNGGNFLLSAEVVGDVIEIDNSVVFSPRSQFERTEVEILEFQNAENIYKIDLVECMPRSLVPFYIKGELFGFAWIYHRFSQIEDNKGPIGTIEREIAMRDRCITFLYTLISLRQVYSTRLTVVEGNRKKFFGKLTLEIGNVINYEYGKNFSTLVHPFAPNIICLIDEIGKSFNLMFNRNDINYPFAKMIDNAIFEDCENNKEFYDNFEANSEDDTAKKMYAFLVAEIISFIAGWVCEKCGDYDAVMWEELNPQDNQYH